jgi:competence protein ComEC
MSRSKKSARINNAIKFLSAALVIIAVIAWNYFTAPSAPVIGTAEFYFFDVGQGDAELIRTSDTVVLIDAGPSSASDLIVAQLHKLGVRTIDVAIFTHPHEDHIGGAAAVIDNFEVVQAILPDVAATTSTYEKMLDALEKSENTTVTAGAAGDVIEVGSDGLRLELLAPCSTGYEDMNDYSIVVRAVFGDNAVIYSGDAESLSESEILDSASLGALKADILKVGHHGSVSSTTEEYLSAISPEYAVISCASDNSYGHPHAETLSKLEAHSITVFRTDIDGDIVFVSDGEVIQPKA